MCAKLVNAERNTMARSKSKPTPESELVAAVQMLTDQVRVLRDAVDELREEVQWMNHNQHGESRLLADRRIQSCFLNSTSRDFAVNTVDQETIEKLRADLASIRNVPDEQGELFN